MMSILTSKELDASRVEPKSDRPVELTEAELDMISGGDSNQFHINNIRLANNIRIGEINIFPLPNLG